MKKIIVALAGGLLLASCATSSPQTRIQREPSKFEALSQKHRSLVEQGRIDRGMPPDAVYLAWGSPSRVFQGSENDKLTERWDYAGSHPVYFSSFHGSWDDFHGPHRVHGYYGGYGFGFGPEVAYVPYRVASVWFINGKVDSWERAR